MPPLTWLAELTSDLVPAKLGADMSPLLTCGAMVVMPTRPSQVPADWALAMEAASASAENVRNAIDFFMGNSPDMRTIKANQPRPTLC
jgi:hypothetical protein